MSSTSSPQPHWNTAVNTPNEAHAAIHVGQRRLQRDQQRSEGEHHQDAAQHDDRDDHQRQLLSDDRREVDVRGRGPTHVGRHSGRERRRDGLIAQFGHQARSLARRRPGLGNHAEDHRVAGLVDERRLHLLDLRRLGQRLLQLHDLRIGAAGITTRGDQILLELVGVVRQFLLLLLRLVGLLLQLVAPLLQGSGLAVELFLLALQIRTLGFEDLSLFDQLNRLLRN